MAACEDQADVIVALLGVVHELDVAGGGAEGDGREASDQSVGV
ncbi:hypothetical protein OHB26_39305 (plasmid) [Nocardia sp. NBC_01503]|nr:hypothetical protein [Nocardia sp. NBC_01503]WTL36727.1 hypothetical protein OHB26_39305 [Nocardia sp. NBC_01503]